MINPKDYPKIEFSFNWNEGQVYVDGTLGWYVETIWEAANDLPEYEVPLVGMDASHQPWDDIGDDFTVFCHHVKLVMDADMAYPIILMPNGALADGRHRLAKAIATGQTTIKVKRLGHFPEPDITFDEDGNVIE